MFDGDNGDVSQRVFAAGPAAESPEIRKYAAWRVCNIVEIGHDLGAQFAVYWPGTLGYQIQGAVEETQTLRWYAESSNAACQRDIEVAASKGRPTMKHCLEAKPFEPQAEILLPTRDAMLGFIASTPLDYPDMVGLNPEYLRELMWGGAPRAVLARALTTGKLWHFRYQRWVPAEARCGYCGGSGEPSGLAECAGMVAQPWVYRAVQSGLQAAAHHE